MVVPVVRLTTVASRDSDVRVRMKSTPPISRCSTLPVAKDLSPCTLKPVCSCLKAKPSATLHRLVPRVVAEQPVLVLLRTWLVSVEVSASW
ncbi:hypothetical protein D3C72_1535950 [compost metagenome]